MSSTAANTPGIESGSTTLVKASNLVAYRSFDASMSRGSICSSETYSGRIVNGSRL